MTLTLYDRVTGTTAPMDALVPGRWSALAQNAGAKMNGAVSRPGDRLVPSRSGRAWRLGADGGPSDPDLVPDEDALRAVHSVVRTFTDNPGAAVRWSTLVAASPLDPALSASPGLLPFEERALQAVVHLQEVCWDPRDQLEMVTEHLPAGRVRRAAPNAEQYLASHSEDWANRSPVRVHPVRLQALVPVENLDLYENRVAARLRDRLDHHCAVRIARLSRLLKQAEELVDYSRDVRGSYRLRTRVAQVWADASDGDDPGRRVSALNDTIETLRKLQRKLSHLRASPLYKGVPVSRVVSGALEATNLLTEHEHYREVGILWRDLNHLEREGAPDPQGHHNLWQELCRSFDAYVALLLVRTLAHLGFAPAAESQIGAGAPPVNLAGPHGALRLSSGDDGTLTLSHVSGRSLRIVALPAALDSPGAAAPREYADLLIPERHTTLVAYLSLDRSTGTQIDLPSATAIGVSPSLLLSEERFARAVHSWTAGTLFSAYPPRIDVPSVLASEVGTPGAGWKTLNPRSASLHCPLSAAEEVELQSRLDAFVKQATARGGELKDRQTALERFSAALREADQTLRALLACPVCSEAAAMRSFETRDGNCFWCLCESCGAAWGLNATGDRRAPYPVLDTPDVRKLARTPDSDVDREVGRDVLAVPHDRRDAHEWRHPKPI